MDSPSCKQCLPAGGVAKSTIGLGDDSHVGQLQKEIEELKYAVAENEKLKMEKQERLLEKQQKLEEIKEKDDLRQGTSYFKSKESADLKVITSFQQKSAAKEDEEHKLPSSVSSSVSSSRISTPLEKMSPSQRRQTDSVMAQVEQNFQLNFNHLKKVPLNNSGSFGIKKKRTEEQKSDTTKMDSIIKRKRGRDRSCKFTSNSVKNSETRSEDHS
mmetsp:Transcript_6228/g.10149  ORF Transcript_6228/g.10149 Transcript_6228/m.10149 type:complete len:214 (-) Transcript_6228:4047-4688(-)